MTDYCTLTQVKTYVEGATNADDELIADLITRASARIDQHCQRRFTGTSATRYFDAIDDVDRQRLLLDDDLLSVTTITNGDGAEVSSANYVLEPANTSPKWAIRLKASSSVTWTYTTDPEQAISVEGEWGYQSGSTPPSDIEHAAIRLTAWYYSQRQAPFETVGLQDLGQVIIPSDMPPDIKALLAPYVRYRVGAA